MGLTGKQRAYLRKLANGIDTVLYIGKGGIGDTLIQQTDNLLEARELIKCRVLDNNLEYTPRTASDELAAKTNSDVVQVIGSRFILYRESQKLPPEERIVLDPEKRVSDTGKRASGTEKRTSGTGKRVSNPEKRASDTEKRASGRPDRNASERRPARNANRPGRNPEHSTRNTDCPARKWDSTRKRNPEHSARNANRPARKWNTVRPIRKGKKAGYGHE